MTINEIQDEIIEEFAEFDDWMDKYQLLITMGEEQEPLPAELKTEQNLIDGCQSRVWLVCDEQDGKLQFRAESDALIVLANNAQEATQITLKPADLGITAAALTDDDGASLEELTIIGLDAEVLRVRIATVTGRCGSSHFL